MWLCIYSDPDVDPDPDRNALMPSLQAPRQWSWSRTTWIDQTQDVMGIIDTLERIFTSVADIHTMTSHPGHPS